MVNLSQVETDIQQALKARDHIAADTLRGLKTRVQSEQTAKGRPERSEGSLSETEILALVRNEVKRRKEAAEVYAKGGRKELGEKELAESAILEKYLPPQISEEKLRVMADQLLGTGSFTIKDFGFLMGKLKSQAGDSADGATLAKILKEKLK